MLRQEAPLFDVFDFLDLVQFLTPRHPVLWLLFMMGLAVIVYVMLTASYA